MANIIKIFLGLFLCLLTPFLAATEINKGKVKGKLQQEAEVPYALKEVFLNSGLRAQTNSEGVFEFDKLMQGEYELSIQIEEQTIYVTTFSIVEGQDSLDLGILKISKTIQLEEAKIETIRSQSIQHLPDVKENIIYAGKKNEVVNLTKIDANLAQNNSRQIFARVAGVHIWENEGSGVQMGIASRGLSPNRMWEFNTRQNGYDIAADPYGYPEAYYTPSIESLDRIEIIRGAASLQFGPQLGGVVNYVKKQSISSKVFGIESVQTGGSYGMFSSFNAIGGKIKKLSYYMNANFRRSDGWRENNSYHTWNGFVNVGYQFTPKIFVSIEYTRMDQLVKQPGGLTDSLFNIDAQKSLRNRNWFQLTWNILALNTNYIINENHRINLKAFMLKGFRPSIGFLSAINIKDTASAATGEYANRRIDEDEYTNYGLELRYLFSYKLGNTKNHLASGIKVYKGHTNRIQNTFGNSGTGFDLTTKANSILSVDADYDMTNVAFFAENMFAVYPRWSITPGVRYEILESESQVHLAGVANTQRFNRQFVLFGIGTQFQVSGTTNLYANFSQGYRPILYSNITTTTTDSIDKNLQDSRGYNIDLGYRGKIKNILQFDMNFYFLQASDKIGTYVLNNKNFRTNIGASQSKGVECFVEFTPTAFWKQKHHLLSFFASIAYTHAEYTEWNNPNNNQNLKNKKVENAPEHIHRYGIHYKYKTLSLSFQYSFVSESYADAINTDKPNASATAGKIPSYTIADVSMNYTIFSFVNLSGGINNLLDERYFTRRAGGYPGPGLMPADGRTWYLGIGVKL